MNEQTQLFVFPELKFDKEKIQETFKDKAKFHDLIVTTKDVFIWPKMEMLEWKNGCFVIRLEFTKHHLDAVKFFRPFVVRCHEKYIKVVLEVSGKDLGLQEMHGKYEFKCFKVCIEYDRGYRRIGESPIVSTETVYFTPNEKHSVLVDEEFRSEAMREKCGNTSDYLNILYERSMLPHKSVLVRTTSFMSKCMNVFISASHYTRRFGDFTTEHLSTAISLNGKAYYTNSSDEKLMLLHGPSNSVSKCIDALAHDDEQFKILVESELEEEFKCSNMVLHDYEVKNSIGKETRSKYQHDSIVDICIALSFLNAPYSILDIIDLIPSLAWANRVRKVRIIESTFASIRKVWDSREEIKNRKI